MAQIDDLTVARIKEASNIKDVIGHFYTLRKHGLTYECLCPFHEDHHIGSFKVSETKNIYTCFSCGAHGGPVDFLMQHEKLQFPEAIAWLGNKYCIEVEGSDKYHLPASKPHAPVPQLPTLILDYNEYVAPRRECEYTTFVKWLRQQNWSKEQQSNLSKAIAVYPVGGTRDGRVIFYQIDENGKCLTGHIMQYEPDGHRSKYPNGKPKGQTWIHSVLFNSGRVDFSEYDYKTTYYGMHLINTPGVTTVNLVESEKTALICSTYFGFDGKQVWLATTGLTKLNKERLKPLIDRGLYINLYPDLDAIDKWKDKAKEIKYDRLKVMDDYMRGIWLPIDGPKADIGDIILRTLKPDIEQMINGDDDVREFVNKFGLEIVNTQIYDKDRCKQ